MSAEKVAVMPMEDYQAICDKVRAKTGGTAPLKSGEIPSELDKLVESTATLGTKTITENGIYSATDDGLDGFTQVAVDVPVINEILSTLGQKTITENGSYSAKNDGLDGYDEVVVNIPESGGTDVSGVTATPDDVLEGAVFVNSQGEEKTGTIPVNGAVGATIDGIETKSVEIPAGYTTGGKVELDGTIDNAVEAAKTSLVNKGVDVPTDTDVRGLAGLIDGIAVSDGEPVYDPTDVKFGSEAIDPDQLYKVGYNWVAQVVDHVQDMVGRTTSFTLEEIVYWLGRVKYIPQGYAESTLTLSFDNGASGVLPVVQRGTASSSFTLNFESSAVGALQEG